MSATDKSGHTIDFSDIQATLAEFNLTGKEAANAAPKWQDNCTLNPLFCDEKAYANRKETELNDKIAVLNRKLLELGLGAIPVYSADTAAKNRQTYLRDMRLSGSTSWGARRRSRTALFAGAATKIGRWKWKGKCLRS
jgi:hypothetical protein